MTRKISRKGSRKGSRKRSRKRSRKISNIIGGTIPPDIHTTLINATTLQAAKKIINDNIGIFDNTFTKDGTSTLLSKKQQLKEPKPKKLKQQLKEPKPKKLKLKLNQQPKE
jgi:hypothetical protein